MELCVGSFNAFVDVCEIIRANSSKLAKVDALATYLASLDGGILPLVCRLILGTIFPAGSALAVSVGYSTIAEVLRDITGADNEKLNSVYLRHGDLGFCAEELLSSRQLSPLVTQELTITGLHAQFERMAKAKGVGSGFQKKSILKGMLVNASPLEARYLIKILTKELRIGLVEGLIEESMAKAFAARLKDVRAARLAVGDIGETALLAKEGRLSFAEVTIMKATDFMLADTMESAPEIVDHCKKPVIVEFKYDGIRAQVHKRGGDVAIFSRNLDNITGSFPEIEEGIRILGRDVILDGEIVPFRDGHPLPFHHLQQRLRRKRDVELMAARVPLVYFAYDLLFLDGQVIIDRPLGVRREALASLNLKDPIRLSEAKLVAEVQQMEGLFTESLELGYEGLVIKDPSSSYIPGRRGKNWVKLKKELDTLDVVVVAAEYGHGKRARILSDYTFSVRDGSDLRVIGKAYSGLTDEELTFMSDLMKELTVEDQGYRLLVKPQVVLEVAFNNIQESSRHDSGFALRFPRIKRIRFDKAPEDIDTLQRVREIYNRQKSI